MTDSQVLLGFNIRQGHPDFLDLPWSQPLDRWTQHCQRIVQVQRGLSRHKVVFVNYPEGIYGIKDLPLGIGEREYNLLRELETHGLPAVIPVGHVRLRRTGEGEERSLILTQYLEASLPYRTLFMNSGLDRYRPRLIGAMASLLVRLHLAGFYWGDCSLSNMLFRRDAGAMQAYLVDAETSEIHETLSNGQRKYDLTIMEENVTGEMLDLSKLIELPEASIYETGKKIVRRYESLWKEITRTDVIAHSERYRIRERIRALNQLGFAVDEVELIPMGEGDRLRMRAIVADRNYHSRMLHSLTGLVATNMQARQMLDEITEFKAMLSRELNRSMRMSSAAFRWLDEVYLPTIRKLSSLIERHTDVSQLYCQLLEHKWFLSEQARYDVGREKAIGDYLQKFQHVG